MSSVRDTAPITNQALWPSLMASLDEPVMQAHIRSKSMAVDDLWMRAMLDGGVLSIMDGFDMRPDSKGDSAFMANWSARVRAFCAFTTKISTQPLANDALVGQLESPMSSLAFAVPESSRDVFRDACAHLCDEYNELNDSRGAIYTRDPSVVKAMTHALVGAIVMDLPDAISLFAEACPRALTHLVPIDELGEQAKRGIRITPSSRNSSSYPTVALDVTPTFVALQLSRSECLSCLYAAGVQPLGMLARHTQDLSPESVSLPNLGDYFFMRASPHAQYTAVKALLDAAPLGRDWREDLVDKALESAGHPGAEHTYNLDAMLRAGVFDLDPVRATNSALVHGHLHILDRVGEQLDWREITRRAKTRESAILASAREELDNPVDGREAAILCLFDRAEKAGHAQALAQTFTTGTDVANDVEPIISLAKAGFLRVLARYVDAGLDIRMRGPMRTTLLADVEVVSREAAEALRVCDARRRALLLMTDIPRLEVPLSSLHS